jgi:beta-lactamase regulating signal transducer with metallopeptidase domain
MFPPEAEAASASVQPSAPLASPVPPRLPVAFWTLAVWGTVAGALLLPLLVGLAAVARLVRAARPFADPEWSDRLRDLSAALGVDRPVRLLCAGPGAMPMAVGLLRPAILLPQEADTWPEEKRRAVLLHELAHVARRDCLTHALARVALALHWFNPLAWVALRQMRIERERACDDRVLIAGERASAYADHLLDIARTMHTDTFTSVAAITMAKQSQLEGRLLAVLDPKQSRYALTRWAVIAAIVGATALLLPLAATKVTSAPPVADTPAAIWEQAKPVLPTQRLFDRGSRWIPRWMQQPQPPFKLDPSDPVETCAAIAQRGNTPQPTGGTQFETDKTRQDLEDILRQRPDYFYAEYLLGTWHRLKGNSTEADDWYRRSFRHAPAIFVQPYTQTDGTPVESGQIVRTFILACYHQEGGVQLPQELWYPLVETDERGAIYLPAYPTVVMTNTLRSGLRSVSSVTDPAIYRPASKDARNNLVRHFVDFPARDYFESEGRIGLLPAAVVQKTGSGSYNSSGKRNPAFSEISTISPAESASLPEAAQPPQLRMISTWTSEKQTPDSLVAWKPDGRPVDNPDEQQVLANYPSWSDSGEPTTQPVVLGLWFHHPLFDNQSEIWFVFYDSAHKKVDSPGGGSNNAPETHKHFPGWRCTRYVFESTHLPDRGQVELRYSLGPWTYFPTTISPTQTGEVPGEPVTIHSIKSAGANATEVSFTVLIPNAENARQCEMVALTDRDSTATVELESRQSGFQLLPDNTGGRYSFHFEAPLEKIKGFRVRHRPIQRRLYDNVVFRRTEDMTTSTVLSSSTASTSPTVAGKVDTNEGELIWLSSMSQTGTEARRVKRNPEGQAVQEIFYQTDYMKLGKALGVATGESGGPIPMDPKKWGPNPEQYLRVQHSVRRQYNSQWLENRTEYFTSNGELFNTDVIEYGEDKRPVKTIRLDARGLKETERRHNPDTGISFDPSGEKVIALSGVIPKDVDLAYGWGPVKQGLAIGIAPGRPLYPYNWTPWTKLAKMPNLIFLTLKNQSNKEEKYSDSHFSRLSFELKDNRGNVVPLSLSNQQKKRIDAEKENTIQNNLTSIQAGHAIEQEHYLANWYRTLPAGDYTLRIKWRLKPDGVELVSNTLPFHTEGWDDLSDVSTEGNSPEISPLNTDTIPSTSTALSPISPAPDLVRKLEKAPLEKIADTKDADFPPRYFEQGVAAIQKNFVLPPYIREGKSCTVRFKILQDGRLVEPQVVEGLGTGITGLDQLALKAVLQAGPVPPYPPEYSKKPFVYARVTFQFTPSTP